MREFKSDKHGGITIVDDAHGVKTETYLPPHEVEQKRNWLGAMGYPADVAAPAAPKVAKKSATKKKSSGKK